MPLKAYGVLRAHAVERVREGGADDTPHYQIHLLDAAGTHYRASVNVKSQETPSELLYRCEEAFAHPVLPDLDALADGWTPLACTPGGVALDLIRANLFDPTAMRAVPALVEGPDNDLADSLDHYVLRAIADPDARVYMWGEPWLERGKPDKVFGFPDGAGLHDVHMNQGNTPAFADDDGVWQDGALIVHFPSKEQWVALFLAFQSQEWHTDDRTGHSFGVVPEGISPRPGGLGAHVRIVAALVNAVADAAGSETVTLLNTTPDDVSLDGWCIADRAKNRSPLSGTIGAGDSQRLSVSQPCRLGNGGGLITVLDGTGLKMDGVAYTWREAKADGWTIAF